MSYRPICDTWILARSKTKYYGAYPAGFLHRARALLGVSPEDAVLHVCGGKVREYPYPGGKGGKVALGPNDRTVDLDIGTKPDFHLDVRRGLPCRHGDSLERADGLETHLTPEDDSCLWDAMLIDRPYTEADAAKYVPGLISLPPLNALLKAALERVAIGGRVGVLDYLWPHPGKLGLEVAVVAVGTGRNARARWFTVFERIAPKE